MGGASANCTVLRKNVCLLAVRSDILLTRAYYSALAPVAKLVQAAYSTTKKEHLMSGKVYTLGYEKRSLEEYVQMLVDNGVELLADVRERPQSRRKGFSKTALKTAVEAAGIAYCHYKELGNPPEIRKDKSLTHAQMLKAYEHHMKPLWDDTLMRLEQDSSNKVVCLTCYERDASECHRTAIANELVRRKSGMVKAL